MICLICERGIECIIFVEHRPRQDNGITDMKL